MSKDYLLFMNPVTEHHGVLSFKLRREIKDCKTHLIIAVDSSTNMHAEIVEIANQRFRERSSQDALIKAYYLHFVLSGMGRKEYEISYDDLCEILGVSFKTMSKINDVLKNYGLLSINKDSWYKYRQSVIKNPEKHKYLPGTCCKYLASWGTRSVKERKTLFKRILKLKYIVPEHLIHKLSYLTKQKSTCKQKPDSTPAPTKDHTHPHITTGDPRDIPLIHKDFQFGNFEVFVPCYEKLNVPLKDVGIYNDDYLRWEKLRSKSASFQSGRIYHAFHNTNREFRKKLKYKNSPLIEALDIHCAFFVFLCLIFQTVPFIDREELKKYEALVRSGCLYEDFMDYLQLKDRNTAKKMLNTYKVLPSSKMKNHPANKYFKDRFPSIQQYLLHYPKYINKDGKEVKSLQKDACFVETVLLSKVCFQLAKLGVTPFTLHDAIYINEKDKKKLIDKGIDINSIFWMVYDAMNPEEIEEILEESRKYSLNNSNLNLSYNNSIKEKICI